MKKKEPIGITWNETLKTTVFSVPEGYFSSLPGKIDQRILFKKSFSKENVFIVPAGYFDSLTFKIVERASYASGLGLPALKKSPFVAPQNYFEDLTEIIQNKPSLEGVMEIGQPEAIHGVPDGYFERLPRKIQERIHLKNKRERAPIYLRPAFQYAMAAGLILFLTVSFMVLYYNFDRTESVAIKKEIQEESLIAGALIANLSKEEIKTYLEGQENIEVHQLIEYSSKEKKEKIYKEFERDFLKEPLGEKDKKDLEIEFNDIDLTELDAEI